MLANHFQILWIREVNVHMLHRLIPKSFLQLSSLKFSSTKSAPCIYIPTMGLDICVLWSTWLSPPSLAQVPLLRSVYQRDLDLLPFSLLQERSHKVYNCNKCHYRCLEITDYNVHNNAKIFRFPIDFSSSVTNLCQTWWMEGPKTFQLWASNRWYPSLVCSHWTGQLSKATNPLVHLNAICISRLCFFCLVASIRLLIRCFTWRTHFRIRLANAKIEEVKYN